MARTSDLIDFLTDVASAIKEKKGVEADIVASQFDTEILALPNRGVYQSKPVTITTNGNYIITPDSNYDAIEEVRLTVNTPVYRLQDKQLTITSNQTVNITADTGYDGLNSVRAVINVEGGGGDDPLVNAILWDVLGFDPALFNILKMVIPLEQQFVAVGGTDEEIHTILEEILEGGNE